MMSNIKILRWIYAVVVVAVMGSCVEDTPYDKEPNVNMEDAAEEMTFVIDLPAASAPTTRGIVEGSVDDNKIEDLFIMLFDVSSGEYVDYIIPDLSAPSGNKYTATALIPSGEFMALTVANLAKYRKQSITALLNDLENNYLKDGGNVKNINDLLNNDEGEFSYPEIWDYRNDEWDSNATPNPNMKKFRLRSEKMFTMSSDFVHIPASRSATTTIRMSRSVAKINVNGSTVAPGAQTPGTKSLQINEIRVVNTLHDVKVLRYFVTPDVFDRNCLNCDMSGLPYGLPLEDWMNWGVSYYDINKTTGIDDFHPGPNMETIPRTIENNSSIDEIFVPETQVPYDFTNDAAETDPIGYAEAWKRAPALLVRGVVDGSQVRWFRINLRMENGSGKLQHVNLVRNHKYTVNITEVRGMGHATAEAAYNALPNDLVVNINAVDESDMKISVYNGQHQLTVNKDEFDFDYTSDTDIIKIFTDYPDGWKIENITWVSNGTDWIAEPTTSSTGSYGHTVDQNISVEQYGSIQVQNNLSARVATFDVVAGPLRITVTVRQRAVRDVFAPPGVLGVGSMTGKLTLRGSKEYEGTDVAYRGGTGTDEFGDLADETVYIVYFKWGSAIGVFGDKSQNGDPFDIGDLAWTPDGYDRAALEHRIIAAGSSNIDKWGTWMYYNGRWDVETNGWPSELDKTEGWGDPCLLADDGAFSNYMVPLGGRLNGGWNNAMFNADGNGTAIWANNPDWYLKTINEVNLVGVANSPILTMFLPAVGYRRGDGGATLMGTMMGFPPDGYTSAWYWSGTSEGLNDVEGWGSLLTITTNPYSPGNIGRTFNSPMRRGSAVPIRCVKNNDTPKARKGVYAPPGVLGVGAETGNLTLKGSNTYKGTAVAHNSEFGPLANEKVYMAYFKYGSAVAISGGEINGETFGPNDIIWRPSGYTKQIVSYGDIEYDDTIDDGKTPTASNPNKGWDDPCALADAGTSVEEWTIPTGGGNDGWNEMWKGTGVGANAGLDWSLAGAAWYNVAGIQGALKDNWKAFIPAAGIRDENGVMNYDGNGHYWSNTAARSLMIASGGAINNDGNIRDRAMPIRCAIKTEPPIIIPPPDLTLSAASILAPPGILGYTLKGELTLRGSRGYKHTPVATGADGVSTTEFGPIHDEQVFIAYFKWGSAIAISAATHPGESNPNAFIPDEDIVWVPKGYKGINTSEEDAREHAWNTVTSWADIRSNSGSGSNGWPVNETEGLGDPCKFIEDHENPGTYPYRLPNGGNGQNSTVNGWHNGYAGTSVNTGVIYSNPHLNWVMAAENTGVTSPKLVYDGLGINDWGIPMPEGMRVRNWDMFLPMSGRRTATGDIEYQNSDGYFWSSTPNGAITGFGLRICNNNYGGLITDPTNSNLGFAYPCLGENQTTPRIQSSYHNAYAIRCVK